MTKVKICGLRSVENALLVARAGADMIGLNFYPDTPRYVEPALARDIALRLREELGAACPSLIGVFVNAEAAEVRAIAEQVGLDRAQLSGDETADSLRDLGSLAFKGIRPVDEAEAIADAKKFGQLTAAAGDSPSILVDAYNPKLYGGTGETTSLNVALAVKAAVARMMLAGGLNPENVGERLRLIRPWAVDVASGVEAGAPGIKDGSKVRAFIKAVRAADA